MIYCIIMSAVAVVAIAVGVLSMVDSRRLDKQLKETAQRFNLK